MMEKIYLKSGKMIAEGAAFHTNSKEFFFENERKYFGVQQRQGSNWRFHSVLSLDIHTVKYEPLGGSSYIPLSDFLAVKKAIINLKNEDDECFKWAITRALPPVDKHCQRVD